MNQFKGLSGNKLNLREKQRVSKINQKNQVQIRPHSGQSFEHQNTLKRLKSQNPQFIKVNTSKVKSLGKSELPRFTKKIIELKNVRQQQQEIQKKIKETPSQIRRTVKRSEIIKTTLIRQNKTQKQLIPKIQITNQQWNKLESYFRYYPVSVIFLCNQKQQLINQYSQGNVKVFSNNIPKKIQSELYQKIMKNAKLKGKYKYRQRHNPNLNQQLKSINYKFIRKQSKNKKKQQSSSEESDDEKNDKRQKFRDLAGWKKSMGVNGKVFIIKGGYQDLRAALLDRGWIENPDKYSKLFDLKWTTKIKDIQFQSLQPKQIVNHFNNNQSLTSKYGLCKTLRTIIFNEGIEIDKFFPRCFDLYDLADFQNFIENYKWTFCQSLLKQFLDNPLKTQLNQNKIKIAILVTQRRITNLSVIVDHIYNKQFAICSPQQWAILTDGQVKPQILQKNLKKYDDFQKSLQQRVKQVLVKLKEKDPQYNLSGFRNIWILKPNYLSRGRGIKCFVKLNQIMDYIITKDMQFVAQKYIENPLLIMNRKFDIRQWVLVEEYNPAKIWFYDECYLRFCAEQYNIENINNKFVHLTNNSIQKYSKQFNKSDIQGNMWSMSQFIKLLEQNQDKNKWEQIKKKMKDIVISSIKSTEDQVSARKNSFQLFGYDFMIDSELNPWLIEINSSPAMDYSTPITKKLVKMVMQDTIKVIIDSKSKKKSKNGTGLFKCIYKGQQTKTSYPIN